MGFFVGSSMLDVLLAELSLPSCLPPPAPPSIRAELTPRFLRKRSRRNGLSCQFSSHGYSHIIGKSWCRHSLELRLEIWWGGWFTSLWKTNQKWLHQAALKTWSRTCVHLAARDVVFHGKVSSPSNCNAFMGWCSSIFTEGPSISSGRRAGREQDFPLQLLHLTAAAQHISAAH